MMGKMVFSNDDIHTIRVERGKRWENMTAEERNADISEAVEEERNAIERAAGLTEEQIAELEAACLAAENGVDTKAESAMGGDADSDTPFPDIGPDFTINDIHRLREWHFERSKHMTPEEDREDIHKAAARVLEMMKTRRESVL